MTQCVKILSMKSKLTWIVTALAMVSSSAFSEELICKTVKTVKVFGVSTGGSVSRSLDFKRQADDTFASGKTYSLTFKNNDPGGQKSADYTFVELLPQALPEAFKSSNPWLKKYAGPVMHCDDCTESSFVTSTLGESEIGSDAAGNPMMVTIPQTLKIKWSPAYKQDGGTREYVFPISDCKWID